MLFDYYYRKKIDNRKFSDCTSPFQVDVTTDNTFDVAAPGTGNTHYSRGKFYRRLN